ncbi:hypothetical protein ACTMS5_02620 [Streptococcus suis]|uniref:hypothetical protein n=1 Tax=Streptococcus suis TaxID=1307 RepID=UPI003F8A9262
MAKPSWSRTLSEVLRHQTQVATYTSDKTGRAYQTDIIPVLEVISIGTIEETSDKKYKYSVVDVANNLEYAIKTPNKINVRFGTMLQFSNVRGGTTNNGTGWYAADSVTEVKRNA